MGLYVDDSKAKSEKIRTLYDWWLSKCAGDIPDRADLDPADLKPLLPNLFIVDVEKQPFRLRYRLVGTRIVEVTGMDITGCYLDELLSPNPEDTWQDYYRSAYQKRAPVFGWSEARTTSGGRFTYEFALFPLRHGGSDVEMFVSIEDYLGLASTLIGLQKWQDSRSAKKSDSEGT